MSFIDKIEAIGLGGFGDRLVEGILAGALQDASAEKLNKFIDEDTPLLTGDHSQIKRIARHVDTTKIAKKEYVLEFLSKNRPDLVSLIKGKPKGIPWLEKQIEIFKGMLTS